MWDLVKSCAFKKTYSARPVITLVDINAPHHKFWQQRQTKINGIFHPEWGYPDPAPSFIRTARVVLVATAVGATAGAGVISSLVERPAAEVSEPSNAARTLTRAVDYSSTPVSTPQAARTRGQSQLPQPKVQANRQAAIEDQSTKPPPTSDRVDGPAASEPSNSATLSAPASNTALVEAPVPIDASPGQAADATTATAHTTPVPPGTPVTERQINEPTDQTKHATTAKAKTAPLRLFNRRRMNVGAFLAGIRPGPPHP